VLQQMLEGAEAASSLPCGCESEQLDWEEDEPSSAAVKQNMEVHSREDVDEDMGDAADSVGNDGRSRGRTTVTPSRRVEASPKSTGKGSGSKAQQAPFFVDSSPRSPMLGFRSPRPRASNTRHSRLPRRDSRQEGTMKQAATTRQVLDGRLKGAVRKREGTRADEAGRTKHDSRHEAHCNSRGGSGAREDRGQRARAEQGTRQSKSSRATTSPAATPAKGQAPKFVPTRIRTDGGVRGESAGKSPANGRQKSRQ
jgi:hypothetical protein